MLLTVLVEIRLFLLQRQNSEPNLNICDTVLTFLQLVSHQNRKPKLHTQLHINFVGKEPKFAFANLIIVEMCAGRGHSKQFLTVAKNATVG